MRNIQPCRRVDRARTQGCEPKRDENGGERFVFVFLSKKSVGLDRFRAARVRDVGSGL